MTFAVSPGVYIREIDKSIVVKGASEVVGGIVIDAPKGLSKQVVDISNTKQFIEMFGEPTPDRPSMYSALAFLEKGALLKVIRAVSSSAVVASCVDIKDGSGTLAFTVYALSEGEWGNSLTVQVTDSDNTTKHFKLTVRNDSGEILEVFDVSKKVLDKDGFGRSMYLEDVINNRSRYIRVVDNTAADVPVNSPSQFSLNGGSDGAALTSAEFIAGWDLLSVPESHDVTVLIQGGVDDTSVQNRMIAIAESRKDCVAILDVPYSAVSSSTPVTDMVNFSKVTLNANSTYAALYGPYVKVYDQYNDKMLELPPSGYVAGVFAETARVAEGWSAPAGLRRGKLNVLGVTTIFTEGDRDLLYKARVNPIQSFAGEGVQVFGQKTLSAIPSALDRINVRMLMIIISKAICKTMRGFLFEANDKYTRDNVQAIINNYMETVKRRRGVVDFRVVCDETNNTAQEIDNNELIVDVYVKPTRSVEFIRINGVILATGASFKVEG